MKSLSAWALLSVWRRPRADLKVCSVFVFLKCADIKTSARGLHYTDLGQHLLTSASPSPISTLVAACSPIEGIRRAFDLYNDRFRRPASTIEASPLPISTPVADYHPRRRLLSDRFSDQRSEQWFSIKHPSSFLQALLYLEFPLQLLAFVLQRANPGHPKAASLRTIPMPFPDLCARLFDGNSATGNFRSYSTQSSSVAGASSYSLPPLQITTTPFHAIDDDGEHTSHHEPPPSAASPSTASPSAAPPSAASPSTASPSGNPNKRAKPSTPIPPSASPSASSPDGTSITGDDFALEMKKALQSLTKGYTIPQCLEKLEVLQLGPTDPLRFVTYHIFGGTMNMREMWMHLPDVPEILRGWLETTGTSLGVLKDGKIVR
ncbi:unnamed protein product [Lactuca saligna]|uniref:Uncharacterized protein n=1 Tax=Lactuca saligna TaxID=75948 RepID=A0AA35Z207_LACSI|nr:unnamed protein product [Lactuca saligna]